MNRRRLFWLLAVVLCLVVLGLALWLPRHAAAQRTSDLYRHYEHNPHLTVAYIEDFPLGDTLAVDVTTLQALDDEGWDTLKKDFNVKPIPDIVLKQIGNGKDIVGVFLVSKENPTLPMDSVNISNNNVVGVSHLNHTIGIFKTESEEQIDAVLHYNYRK